MSHFVSKINIFERVSKSVDLLKLYLVTGIEKWFKVNILHS